jgi:inorganic triphosphatase YgiF
VAARGTLERVVKLEAEPGFALPDQERPLRTFESTYFDSADGRLRRARMTLRRRTEAGARVWQLKLPRGDARLELEGGEAPSEELVAALGSVLRGRLLEPVVTMRTRRSPFSVAGNGTELAEVAIDEVEVLAAGEPQGCFAELEVGLRWGDPRDLRRIVKRLRKAGARPAAPATKLDRVLGAPAEPDGELERALATQVRTLLAHEVGLRLAPEDVHQLRVALRRLRAYLQAAGPLLDGSWSEPLREELQELGRTLGEARDLDVLIGHLEAEGERLGEPAGAKLVEPLRPERTALERLLAFLTGERWHALLDRLEEELPRRAGPALEELAAAEAKRLRKRHVPADASDEQLHDLRKRVKRARYGAELADEGNVVARAKEV